MNTADRELISKKRLFLGWIVVNGLGFAYKVHDIAYDKSNSLTKRSKVDRVFKN